MAIPQNYVIAFKDRFWAIHDFCFNRIQNLNEFLSLISKRIVCEQSYSNDMMKIGKTKLNFYGEYYLALTLAHLEKEYMPFRLIVSIVVFNLLNLLKMSKKKY